MNYLLPLYFCLLIGLAPAKDSGYEMGTKNGQMELYSIAEPCPEYLDSSYNISEKMVETVLAKSSTSSMQIKTNPGINHLNFDNLELLTSPVDDYACSQLNDFKNHWLKDDELEDTYYRIDNYYFMVRWYNGNMFGFLPVFIFDAQFELRGVLFY